MIGPSGAVRVMVATKPVDFRKGMEGLATLVRESMAADPFSGAVYVFRAKRAQHATFCIQSSKRDNCISVASAFSADASGRTFPTRQGFEV
ncbi:IS66 family insertion sequence element accessory protein TnpB, partial [Bradyrhizobium uaiense]|nr:transposase [Bradyrhizobium uaiense]